MQVEPIIRIILVERGEAIDDVRIEGADALLGSASHCHVRRGPDKLAREQLRFEARDGALSVEVRSETPAVTLDRLPWLGGRLPEGSALRVGSLEVRATLERSAGASTGHARARSRAAWRPRPIVVAIGALLVVALALALLPRRERATNASPQPPALFSDQAVPCPETDPRAALAAALEYGRSADAKRERAPFLPEEGLQAVHAYWRAASCWQLAGGDAAAATARRRGDALRTSVERDYHLHQVRVYLAQRSSDSQQLAREARVLASYVKGRSDRYVDWLDQLQRELEANTHRKDEP